MSTQATAHRKTLPAENIASVLASLVRVRATLTAALIAMNEAGLNKTRECQKIQEIGTELDSVIGGLQPSILLEDNATVLRAP